MYPIGTGALWSAFVGCISYFKSANFWFLFGGVIVCGLAVGALECVRTKCWESKGNFNKAIKGKSFRQETMNESQRTEARTGFIETAKKRGNCEQYRQVGGNIQSADVSCKQLLNAMIDY